VVILEKDKIEYQEANALFRHWNRVGWMANSIFVSAAYAVLGLTWEVTDVALLILFAMTSMGLSIIGFLAVKRLYFYGNTILDRIWQLEKQMGLNLHLLIKRKDEEATLKSPILHSLKKLRTVDLIIRVVLLLLWVLRIVLSCFF